jgi:hypothetical protein
LVVALGLLAALVTDLKDGSPSGSDAWLGNGGGDDNYEKSLKVREKTFRLFV